MGYLRQALIVVVLFFSVFLWGEEKEEATLIQELKGIVFSNDPDLKKMETLHNLKGVKAIGVEKIGHKLAWRRFSGDLEKRFLNRPMGQEQLEELRGAVAFYYEKQGHPFVQVVIPPQEVTDGILQIMVYESVMGEITLKGNHWTKDWQILNNIELKSGDPIEINRLNADLAFLNRNPFRQTNAIFSKGDKDLTTNLDLVTKELRPFRVYVGIDNRGNEAFGRLRQFEGFNWGNFLGFNQVLSYQLTTSVKDVSNLVAHALYYEIPLPKRQSFVFFGGASRIQNEDIDTFTTNKGRNIQGSGRYHFPLFATGNHYHDVYFGFDFKQSNNNALFSEEPIFANITTLSQFVLAYQYQSGWKWGNMIANGSLYFSPARFFSYQSTEAYRTLSPGARPKYYYLKGELSSQFYLPKRFGISYLLTLQYANQNLLPSEQLGLGGFDTVRGYYERVINGDSGIFSSVTITAPPLSLLKRKGKSQDKLTFLGFIDYGWTTPHRRVYASSTGEELTQKTNYILGIGPGLRYVIDPYLTFALYWGVRLRRTEFQNHLGGRVSLSLVVSY